MRVRPGRPIFILSGLIALIASFSALSAGLPDVVPSDLPFDINNLPPGFDPSQFEPGTTIDPRDFGIDPLSFLPADSQGQVQTLSDALVKAIGLGTDQRSYRPATPLGTHLGIAFGLEATLVKVPDDVGAALAGSGNTAGAAAAGSTIPVLPVPRIILHKGFGQSIDLGLGFVFYAGNKIVGGDFKWAFYQPEEGPTWAFRLNYTETKILYVTTTTYTPQLLISKKMNFADPFLGVGYQFTSGSVEIPVPLPAPFEGQNVLMSASSKTSSFMAFLGVGFEVIPFGLRIVLGGSYSVSGMHSMGTTVGFTF